MCTTCGSTTPTSLCQCQTTPSSTINWGQILFVPDRLNSDNIYQTETIEVSSAEILALNGTPKRLLPVLTSAFMYDVVSVAAFNDFGTLGYTAANGLAVRSTGVGLNDLFEADAAFLQAAADQYCVFGRSSSLSNNNAPNTGIELYEKVANPTVGDGTLKIYITYRIIAV